MKHQTRVFFCILALLLFSCQLCLSKTLFVSSSPSAITSSCLLREEACTFNTALLLSEEGDKIFFLSGTYDNNPDSATSICGSVVNKTLTLEAEPNVVISCGFNATRVLRATVSQQQRFLIIRQHSSTPEVSVTLNNFVIENSDIGVTIDTSQYYQNVSTKFQVTVSNVTFQKCATGILIIPENYNVDKRQTAPVSLKLVVQDSTFKYNVWRGIQRTKRPAPSSFSLTIRNSLFHRNVAQLLTGSASVGGAISITETENSEVSIFNSTFTKNGPPLALLNATFIDTDAAIPQNTSLPHFKSYKGAALFAEDVKTIRIEGSTFEGNEVFRAGGVICVERKTLDTSVTIIDSTLSRNDGARSGGAVMLNAGTLHVKGTSLVGNTADDGGAIYVGNLVSTTVIESKFHHNYAKKRGGALMGNNWRRLDMSYSTLINNTALEVGSVIYSEGPVLPNEGTMMSINHTSISFSNPLLMQAVPAKVNMVHAVRTNVVLDSSVFHGNTGGSAVFISNVLNDDVTYFAKSHNSTFSKNDAYVQQFLEAKGAAIAIRNTVFEVIGSSFVENEASTGGAIFILQDANFLTSIKDSVFKKNLCPRVQNTFQAGRFSGGAIAIETASCEIIRTLFDHNDAVSGGAIAFTESQLTIHNSTFSGNSAQYNAGAILGEESFDLAIRGSSFIENTADEGYGGAMLLDGRSSTDVYPSTIFDSSFIRNKAPSGGAMAFVDRLTYRNRARVSVEGSIFSENHASLRGGSVYISSQRIEFTDVTFEKSDAISGGAIYAETSSLLYLKKSLVTKCEARGDQEGNYKVSFKDGGAIFVAASSLVSRDSTFLKNKANQGRGGAIACDECDVSIFSVQMIENEAADGGGLSLRDPYGIILIELSFLRNKAAFGGGMKAQVKSLEDVVAMDLVYIQNSASIAGGGIFFDHFSSAVSLQSLPGILFMLENVCTFDGNTAARYGNSYASLPSSIKLSYLSFFDRVPTIQSTSVGGETGMLSTSPSTKYPYLYSNQRLDGLHEVKTVSQTGTSNVTHDIFPSQFFDIAVKVQDAFGNFIDGFPNLFLKTTLRRNEVQFSGEDFEESVQKGFVNFHNFFINGPTDELLELKVRSTSNLPEDSLSIFVKLIPCPAGYEQKNITAGQVTQFRCEWCALGTYSIKPASESCSICKSGLRCEGYEIISEQFYWPHVDNITGQVTPYFCPNQKCRAGNKCADNRDPNFPLCGKCLPEYSEWNGICTKCTEGINFGYVLLVNLYIIGIFLFNHISSQTRKSGATKILFFYAQTLGLIVGGYGNFLTVIPSIFNFQFFMLGTGASVIKCPFYVDSIGKIMVGVSRPLSLLLLLFAVFFIFRVSKGIYKTILNIIRKVQTRNLKKKLLAKQASEAAEEEEDPEEKQGTLFTTRQVVNDDYFKTEETKEPTAVAEDEGLQITSPEDVDKMLNEEDEFELEMKHKKQMIYQSYNEQKGADVLEKSKVVSNNRTIFQKLTSLFKKLFLNPSAYILSLSNMLIVTYQGLAEVAFDYFSCLKIGDREVLVSATDIECYSVTWVKYLPLFIVIGAYVLLFPLALLIFLLIARYMGKLYRKRFARYFGLLYLNYRSGVFWYESYAILRRTVLIGSVAIGSTFLPRVTVVNGVAVLLCAMLAFQVLLKPYALNEANMVEVLSFISLIATALIVGADAFDDKNELYMGLSFIAIVPTFLLLCLFVVRHSFMRKPISIFLNKVKAIFTKCCGRFAKKKKAASDIDSVGISTSADRAAVRRRKYAMREMDSLRVQGFSNSLMGEDEEDVTILGVVKKPRSATTAQKKDNKDHLGMRQRHKFYEDPVEDEKNYASDDTDADLEDDEDVETRLNRIEKRLLAENMRNSVAFTGSDVELQDSEDLPKQTTNYVQM